MINIEKHFPLKVFIIIEWTQAKFIVTSKLTHLRAVGIFVVSFFFFFFLANLNV
jgi:hypothetical protein